MLGICRSEYTINETCIGHFLWKYCIYNKIKIKLPLLKTYIVLLKKNRTSSVFMLEEKQRQFLNPLKISYKTYEFFSIFFFVFYWLEILGG